MTVTVKGLGQVARIGLGTSHLAGDIKWGLTKHEELSIDAVRHGLDDITRIVDTSPSYGPNLAEQYLARALKNRHHDVLVATKAGVERAGDGARVPAGSPEAIRQSVRRSLKNLEQDHLDLVQLHAPDPEVPLTDSLGALFDMRAEGVIREVGVCNVSPTQLEVALEVGPLATVQNQLSVDITDPYGRQVLDLCERHGIAFLAHQPLGSVLTKGRLAAAATRYQSSSPTQLALRLLLEASPALVAIPGSVDVAHIRANQKAEQLALTQNDVAALLSEAGADPALFPQHQPRAQDHILARLGPTPQTTLEVPQQQVNQNAPTWARQELLTRASRLPGVQLQDTRLAIPGSVALHVKDGVGASQPGQFMAGREFMHFHPPHDGSIHAIFSDQQAHDLQVKRWAVPHLLTDYIVHRNSLMIFGPRDKHEVETCWRIIQMSHEHATASAEHVRW